MAWTWAAASRIGTSHIRNGTPCQDAHRCFERDGVLVAIASDGAGSASHGHHGAALTCRTFATGIGAALREDGLPDDETLHAIVDNLRDRVAHVASGRGLVMRDFAATLVAVVAGEAGTLAVHVGDGAAVGRDAAGWRSLSWPESGEFAGTTYFVTDDGGARLRISRTDERPDRVAVMTDGIERLALDLANARPHGPFFDGVTRPLDAVSSHGRSPLVSGGLGAFLAGDAVNARTDDDKTLVLARRL